MGKERPVKYTGAAGASKHEGNRAESECSVHGDMVSRAVRSRGGARPRWQVGKGTVLPGK